MKYIRKYNEDILDPAFLAEYVVKNDKLLDDVKDDVKSYLSYLLDDSNFHCDVRIAGSWDNLSLQITIGKNGYHNVFKFDEVKDDIIPFYQILDKKYGNVSFSTQYLITMKNQRGTKVDYGTERFKNDDVINDRIGDGNILSFRISIKANDKPAFVPPKKKTLLDKFKGIFK
jgi:hypothetical protein